MNEKDKRLLKSILNTLAHISYTALIELEKSKDVKNEDKIKELEQYKIILEEEIIEKLFT